MDSEYITSSAKHPKPNKEVKCYQEDLDCAINKRRERRRTMNDNNYTCCLLTRFLSLITAPTMPLSAVSSSFVISCSPSPWANLYFTKTSLQYERIRRRLLFTCAVLVTSVFNWNLQTPHKYVTSETRLVVGGHSMAILSIYPSHKRHRGNPVQCSFCSRDSDYLGWRGFESHQRQRSLCRVNRFDPRLSACHWINTLDYWLEH